MLADPHSEMDTNQLIHCKRKPAVGRSIGQSVAQQTRSKHPSRPLVKPPVRRLWQHWLSRTWLCAGRGTRISLHVRPFTVQYSRTTNARLAAGCEKCVLWSALGLVAEWRVLCVCVCVCGVTVRMCVQVCCCWEIWRAATEVGVVSVVLLWCRRCFVDRWSLLEFGE